MSSPTPVVLMYILSALPCSTTLVSPPTMETPALRAASAMARISASSTLVGNPSSNTNVATKALPMAPETARSFIVPFTARSPIEPPGNWIGLTTKLSVVIAMGAPLICTWAESESDCGTAPASSGTNKPSTSLRLALPPAPCAISICLSRKRTTGGARSAAFFPTSRCSPFRLLSECSSAGLCDVRSCDTLRMSPR